MILRLLLVVLASVVLTALITPLVIFVAKKTSARQTILSYVDNHSAKSGTPTMGGIAFIISTSIVTWLFSGESNTLSVMLTFLLIGFGVVGFLDDFIKIKFHRNEGLTPLQKGVFQLLVAVIVSLFVYSSPYVGDKIYLPFVMREVKLGWFALPFFVFIFVAFSNAVNLTDGLDGLAGKTAAVYVAFFCAVVSVTVYSFGLGANESEEMKNVIIFCGALGGALIGFIIYNGYPASIFMGDTGALALGGALGGLAVMTKMSLIAPIIGIMYVVSCVSDIIQVLHYKRTKKRIFLMAPFHHHLERKGWHENKIVALYTFVTFLSGAISLVVIVLVN